MRQRKNPELDTRIQNFLDKKFTKFPELRASVKAGRPATAKSARIASVWRPFQSEA